jgi:4-amino-4-deoxy-L-arabinose transferase-like glycosyltransferase
MSAVNPEQEVKAASRQDAAGTSSQRVGAGFVLALLAGSVLLALALWAVSFREVAHDRDEGVYATVARSWAAGRLPYRDVFDHKPPVIYLLYRAIFGLFGESLAAVRVAFAVMSGATGVGAALVLRAACPAAPRLFLVLAALATVYWQAGPTTAGGTANCEVPMMLLLTAGALAALRFREGRRWQWLALLGVAGGLALLTKPVCALELALFVAVAVTGRRDAPASSGRLARELAIVATAAALPFAVAIAYFWSSGGLAAAVDAVVAFNIAYAAGGAVPLGWRTLYLAKLCLTGFPPLLAGALLLVVLAARRAHPAATWLFPLWVLAAIVGVQSAGRPYRHYLQQLTVPLACAAAAGAAILEERTSAGARRRARLAWVAAGLILLVPPLRATASQLRGQSQASTWDREVGEAVASRTAPHDTIVVWGAEAQIYYFAKRAPASRFIYKYPLKGNSARAVTSRSEFLREVLAARPGAIVVVRNDATPEDRVPSDQEWQRQWVPALGPLLEGYARSVTPRAFVYIRR